ncbi:MAG TPA: hypothetical protein DCP28_22940 [Cytophagales bacterium]|nr:hypothetical protein [Cytophagales bacterium]
MKRILLASLITMWLLSSSYAQVQVSGTVTLFDDGDPSGISVVFTAASASATTNSTTTDGSGNYSISLDAGDYEIDFSKTGYRGVSLGERFLAADSVLETVELQEEIAEISGTIADGTVWSAGVNYVVTANATLPFGSTLTVDPGAVIKIASGVDLSLRGTFALKGTETDSIIFTKESDAEWGTITLEDNLYWTNESDMEYVRFEYGDEVLLEDKATGLRHCTLLQTNLVDDTDPIDPDTLWIVDSYFEDCTADFGGGNGTVVNVRSSTWVNKTLALSSSTFAMRTSTSLFGFTVENSQIEGYQFGIIDSEAGSQHSYNTFVDNTIGVQPKSGTTLFSNTFYENDNAVEPSSGSTTVNSNLFLDNGHAFAFSESFSGSFALSYNLFDADDELISSTTVASGLEDLGTIITTSEGQPADKYLNIVADPELHVDASDDENYLRPSTSSSAAVDTGDPDFTDEEGSRLDIGARQYLNIRPDAVTNVQLAEDTISIFDEITISWSPSEDPDNFGANEEVTYFLSIFNLNDPIQKINVGTDTSYTTNGNVGFVQNTGLAILIQATDGYDNSGLNGANIFVGNEPPGEFTLMDPARDTVLADVEELTFLWNTAWDTDSVGYTFYLMNEDATQDTTLEATDTTVAWSWAEEARWEPNATYTWYVLANDGQDSTYSDTLSFSIANEVPEAFTITAPSATELVGISDTVAIGWTTAQDEEAIIYTVQVTGGELDTTLITTDTTLALYQEWEQNTTYSITIGASDGQDTTQASLTFQTENIAPASFGLLSPQDSVELVPGDPVTFVWEASLDTSEPVEYSLFLTNLEESDIEIIDEITDTSYVWTEGFEQNQDYEWYVVASDGIDDVPSTTEFGFTVANAAPGAFGFTAPAANATFGANEFVSFAWTEAEDDVTVLYHLRVFGGNLDSTLALNTARNARIQLAWEQNATYQAYAWATDGVDTTGTDTVSFSINNLAPEEFTLGEPADGELVDATLPITFTWNQALDVDLVTYRLWVSGPEGDTSSVSGDTAIVFDGIALLNDTEYSWWVVASDGQDSTTSTTRALLVENAITGLGAELQLGLQLYPNPAKEVITINWHRSEMYSLQIVDMKGRVVYEEEEQLGTATIPIKAWAPGMYRAVVRSGDKQAGCLLVIER